VPQRAAAKYEALRCGPRSSLGNKQLPSLTSADQTSTCLIARICNPNTNGLARTSHSSNKPGILIRSNLLAAAAYASSVAGLNKRYPIQS
jgi:hypothetical protein